MDQQSSQTITSQPPAQTQPSGQTQPPTSVSPVIQNQNAENYFNKLFTGRLNRRNYFVGALFIAIIEGINGAIGFNSPAHQMATRSVAHTNLQITDFITIPLAILILFFGASLAIRRLHDMNKTGWLMLIMYIPIIGAVYGLYVLLAEGTAGQNNYGPQPLPRVSLNQDILKLS